MLNIVVAWMAEARPLVDHYRLEPLSKKYGFRIYRNSEINLVVCGQGRAAAAAGTAWLQALVPAEENGVWLNVGIAGHRDLAIGSAIVGNLVRDRDSGRWWRLPLLSEDAMTAKEIITVGQPDLDYATDAVVDMEASAFVETALRFAERDAIGCLKVISDNASQPASALTPSQASELIGAQIDAIASLAAALEKPHAG